MSNEHEVFSFDLNESLYFERGQEVAEMIGISLDPEISIQPFNDYISIRGVIELHGTYQRDLYVNPGDDDIVDLEDYHSRRYIEKVTKMDNNQSEFTHRFPVEISVPTYRVADLNEVTVDIESFDYEIPNHNQLKLSSTIEIRGISDQSGVTPELAPNTDNVFMPSDEETFEFDIKAEEETPDSDQIVEPENTPVLSPETDTGTDINDESDDDDKSGGRAPWKSKKSQTLAEFLSKDDVEVSEESNEEHSSMQDYNNDYESPEHLDNNEGQTDDVEDVRYLADMFRSDDEQYAKMRLCIVQDSDTVESIADRYELTPIQIVNQNHLTDDSLEDGQLLYIPYKEK